jgi:FG-GAP-like repeat
MMNRYFSFLLTAFSVLPLSAAETHFYPVLGADALFSLYNSGLDTFEMRPFSADFDGDGDFDILAGNHGETGINFWRNTGTPTAPVFTEQFVPALATVTSTGGCGLCMADFDSDGDGDLIVISNSEDSPYAFQRNTGTAAAPVFVEETGPGTPLHGVSGLARLNPAPGDIDGDGDLDLVAADGNQRNLVLLRNTGTPAAPVFVQQTFAPLAGITVTWAPAPALADTDDDGDLDLFTGYSDNSDIQHLRFYRNTGTPAAPVFTLDHTPLPYRALESVLTPAVADFNADGFPDLLCGAEDQGFVELRGGPPLAPRYTEVSGASHPVNTAATRYCHCTADLDGDGDSDLVCGTGSAAAATLTFLRNTGSNSAPSWNAWGGAAPAPAIGNIYDVELANVDGGSPADLLIRVHNGVAYVLRYYRNTGTAGTPAFTERTGANNPFSAITGDNSPALADLDNDGDPDLVAGKRYYENTGSLTTPVFTLRTGAQSPLPDLTWITVGMVPELADADGDGDFDLAAVSGIIGGRFLFYCENTGSPASPVFTLRTGADSLFATLDGANRYADIHIANWNNDAVSDLMLTITGAPAPAGLRFLSGLRTGPPTYEEWIVASFGVSPGAPETHPAADPDGDGVMNLVEFAVNTPPLAVSEIPFTHTRTPAGLLQIALTVRNNDPVLSALSARGEGSASLSAFSGNIAPVVTDPAPGDGYSLWTFTDVPPPGANPRRFLRAVFQVN